MVDLTLAFMALQTLSITIGVVYHIMTLQNTRRNQRLTLETRQTQLFMGIYDKAQSEAFIDAMEWWRAFEYESIDEFMEMIHGDTPEAKKNRRRFSILGVYYEGLGVLVKEGLLNIRLVALMMAGMVLNMWEKLEPVIEEYRSRTRTRMASESEYLYNELMRYLEEHPELKT
jgi:hypothetical protein